MNFLIKASRSIKDYVFPTYCLGCLKEGVWLCNRCLAKIDVSGMRACPVCHHDNTDGRCCYGCSNQSYLKTHQAVTVYSEKELIGKIIHTLKYQYAEDVLVVFKKLIIDYFESNKDVFLNIDVVVPVPLHSKRFAERGFNQAEKIANIASENLGLPAGSVLKRSRYTESQARLDKIRRKENVRAAFCMDRDERSVCDKNILIIDDVFTTGSTIEECSRVLIEAGARSVSGFSVARG